jgi:hypothetical protein
MMLLARLLPDFSPAREHPAFRRLLAGLHPVPVPARRVPGIA